MTFNDFGLNDNLLEAIEHMGFEKPTPIQERTIPEIMAGNDLIASAQTGTGKTAAFLLPVLNKFAGADNRGINTLILVPTRELAIQIDQQIQGLAYFTPVVSMAVYGGGTGGSWEQEKNVLRHGADIVVATPGKLISHLKMGYVNFSRLRHLILDEADRMLDIGFYDDIMNIISYVPEKRQTLLFSATIPPKINELAARILVNPVEIRTSISKPAEGVLQAAYMAYDHQKVDLIKSLIADKPEYNSILIFASTKKKVSEIARTLKSVDKNVEGISSDLEQHERNEVLLRFKSNQTRILVATDVMSRGIDIKNINLIINFDVPGDAEDYVHRVGRTARADKTGVALTLINEDDVFRFSRIEKLIEQEVLKIPLPGELGDGPFYHPRSKRKVPGYRKGKKKNKGSYRKRKTK